MKFLLQLILKTVSLNFLSGYKTYIAAVGLVSLGLTRIIDGDTDSGVEAIIQGIAAMTVRKAIR